MQNMMFTTQQIDATRGMLKDFWGNASIAYSHVV